MSCTSIVGKRKRSLKRRQSQTQASQKAKVTTERNAQSFGTVTRKAISSEPTGKPRPFKRNLPHQSRNHRLSIPKVLDDFRNRDDVFSDLRHDEGPRYSPNVVSRQTNQMW